MHGCIFFPLFTSLVCHTQSLIPIQQWKRSKHTGSSFGSMQQLVFPPRCPSSFCFYLGADQMPDLPQEWLQWVGTCAREGRAQLHYLPPFSAPRCFSASPPPPEACPLGRAVRAVAHACWRAEQISRAGRSLAVGQSSPCLCQRPWAWLGAMQLPDHGGNKPHAQPAVPSSWQDLS